ncbi:MAG: hypothetical protein ACFFB5_12970 [Promethearchaeota archaeon]
MTNEQQPLANTSEKSSEKVHTDERESQILPITTKLILWVLFLMLGVIVTLMMLFISLAYWVVTKEPLFLISAIVGGFLFVIWVYKNLSPIQRKNERLY